MAVGSDDFQINDFHDFKPSLGAYGSEYFERKLSLFLFHDGAQFVFW